MKLGRLLGVELYLNPFFLALLALFFVTGVLIKGLLAFGVVLVHEFAHVAVARRLDVPVSEIELLPFGGVARMESNLVADPVREMWVAVAGPFCNLGMILLAVAARNYGFWDEDLGTFFLQCNLLVGVFNLLPALPLDGGRVYRACLARRVGISRATRRAARAGQLWAVFLTVLGGIGFVFHLTGLDVLITSFFLFYAATREYAAAPYFFAHQLIYKGEELGRAGLMPVRTLVALEDVPLGMVARAVVPRKYHLVVVLNGQWRIKGTVTEGEIIDRLTQEGSSVPIGSLIK